MQIKPTKINSDSIYNLPSQISNEIIWSFCEGIINYFHPLKIYLFGSYAKGDFTANSDLDLLVIIDDLNPLAFLKRRDRYSRILKVFPHKGFSLDAIVLTNKEIQKLINENEGEWDLIIEVLNEGKVLYEQETEVE